MGKRDYKHQYQLRKKRQSAAKDSNFFSQRGIIIGEIYGNYEVLEKVKVPRKVSRGNGVYVECMATMWKCRYIPDGTIKITTTGYLSEFKTVDLIQNEVQKLVGENKHQMGFRKRLYNYYKKNANSRKHGFFLTQEEFESLIFQNCYYCGSEPKEMTDKQFENYGDKRQPKLKHNGIDRIDSNGDYTVENCVPCCAECNYMKHVMSRESFLNKIVRIYNNLDLGSTTIPKGSTPQANGGGNGEPLTGDAEGEDIV